MSHLQFGLTLFAGMLALMAIRVPIAISMFVPGAVGYVILAESALSFIGLGVASPDISWGAMLADGRELMTSAWWLVAFPGLSITIVVVLISLLGDAVKARYDPRARAR